MRSIDQMTLADLRRALDDKERELRALLERKDRLAEQIEALGDVLQAMLAGSGAAPGRGESVATRAATTAAPKSGRAPKSASRKAATNGRSRAARAPRENSLPVVIRGVLERVLGPMRVAEIAEAVVKAGYASKSKNLPIIVANRVAHMDDVEKVDRGLYQLKRSGSSSDAAAEPTNENEAAAEQTAG